MGTGKILPTLITLGLPAATAGITQTLFEVADTLFISRLGKDQISGVGLVGPVIFTVFAVAQAVNVGIAALVSRSLGAKQHDRAQAVLTHGLIIAAVVGTLSTILLLLFLDPILASLGEGEGLTVYSRQFASIIFLSVLAMHMGTAADGALRAQGNTITPMKIGIAANIANIILCPILIFGLKMGVAGAATATVITRTAMAAVLLRCLWSPHSEVRPGRPAGATAFWSWRVVGAIYWMGLPASIGMAAMSVSMIFINALLTTIDPYAVGTVTIAFRIESFAFTPVFGLFSAVVPMVGYNYGARRIDRCSSTIWTASGLAAALMGAVGLLIFIMPGVFFGAFSRDPELLQMGIEYLRLQVPVYAIVGASIMSSAGFQGLGMSWMGMLSHIWRNLALKLPFAYWFAGLWGLTGVWWSFPISTALSSTIFIVFMYLILKRLRAKYCPQSETCETEPETTALVGPIAEPEAACAQPGE